MFQTPRRVINIMIIIVTCFSPSLFFILDVRTSRFLDISDNRGFIIYNNFFFLQIYVYTFNVVTVRDTHIFSHHPFFIIC